MARRFNGRISNMLKTRHFRSGEDVMQTSLRYVAPYNHPLLQSALKSKTPIQALKHCHDSYPHLLAKRLSDRPGYDRQVI